MNALVIVLATILVASICGGRSEAAEGQEFSAEAIQAAKGFVLAEGVTANLYATEPMVANPVAFSIDETGNVYVCETYRVNKGVEDNRNHPEWLDDDLAAKTVADRLAYFKKHLGDNLEKYSEAEDRIRLLSDSNNDGRADTSSIFADGFKDPLEGTGAGVLARKGNIYYTCIPKLWAFRDDNGDGKADRRLPLADGFGVRVSFYGHDLHGLTLGPDGRIYFSIGDRGYHVETKNGVLANAETGAVFRCEQDGSRLEVFATGMRNPQELAFDDFGNLFTADNNSDGGDLARWVHVLEGGDSGWRMPYQYLPDRGPWNQEKLWEPYHVGQPAYIVPAVANLADGPSGLAHYPGTGLAPSYVGNFFLCDFRGQAGQSGIRTFKVRPKGATFELIDPEVFLWNCLATDVTFGPDGAMYVLDWVDGWEGTGKGRIHRLVDKKSQDSPVVAEVRKLLAMPKEKMDVKQLVSILEHVDQRIRLEAQMELALRREISSLLEVAVKSNHQLARFHAIEGLGQIARVGKKNQEFLDKLLPLLRDVDPIVRATTATVMGDAEYAEDLNGLLQLMNDSDHRVRYSVAMALSKLKTNKAVSILGRLLQLNKDTDPALRHAYVVALAACASDAELKKLAQHDDRSVRLGALLAMRRTANPALVEFLQDSDEQLVVEAGRAIYDLPMLEHYSALAAKIETAPNSIPLQRRILAANFRLGGADHALALAKFAADSRQPIDMRVEAIDLLGMWETPSPRDRVLGAWRPIEPRSRDEVKQALQATLADLVRSGLEIRLRAVQQAAALEIEDAGRLLFELLDDQGASPEERAGVLLALGTLSPPNLDEVVQQRLTDPEPRLRAAARILLTRRHPEQALEELTKAVRSGEPLERKSALALTANLATEGADHVIAQALESLQAGTLQADMQLEAITAGRRRNDNPKIAALVKQIDDGRAKDDPLAPYRETLEGGSADRGRQLFTQRVALSCVRCHKIDNAGGAVGPDLTHIAKDKSREYLLEAIVAPNKSIAKGFETVVVELNDGSVVSGIVQKETDATLTLIDVNTKTRTIDKQQIADRSEGQSSMPADLLRHLTLFDLRDLVEYLASLK